MLLGDGKGGYEKGGDYEAGVNATEAAIADYNGDTFPDIALSELGHNQIIVFLNNGAGGFPAELDDAIKVPLGAGAGPNSIAAADFNHDGLPDLVTANRISNRVSLVLNNGKKLFSAPVNIDVGVSPRSITTGDFNGDTHTDIATANLGSANVSLLFGNGDGTFDSDREYRSAERAPSYIVSADVNHDQHLDLIIANGTASGHSVVDIAWCRERHVYFCAQLFARQCAGFIGRRGI